MHRPVFLIAALLLGCFASVARAQTALIPTGSIWRFLDDGSDQGLAWSQPGFDDSAWSAGPAKLGYGDSDVVTPVSFGGNPDDKHIATYFRHEFQVASPAGWPFLALRMKRDDGAVVYLNGVEQVRKNLSAGAGPFDTANNAISGAGELSYAWDAVDPGLLVAGTNVVAVRVHQSSDSSSDLGFDLELLAGTQEFVTRGPYLQGTHVDRTIVRWRTHVDSTPVVRYGTAPDALNLTVTGTAAGTEHSVELTGLQAATTYYYSVGTPTDTLAGADASHRFTTAPATGSEAPVRVWVLGDSGEANDDARAVRDAYTGIGGLEDTDLVLMLGDNAYDEGTDLEYQGAVFDMYPEYLRRMPFWPARGNHEDKLPNYLKLFDLPAAGEAGGVPSGSETYYAFDWANVHFLCLDSEGSSLAVGGPMWTWAQSDLQNTQAEWVIAYWHHPPYSKGSHDSDTSQTLIDMRENFLPLLESHGVDLVLSGHSHSLERSFLLDGHYGDSASLAPENLLDTGDGQPTGDGAYVKVDGPRSGAVYAVAGSSSKLSDGPLDHPVMVTNLMELGSLRLDVQGSQLDLRFIDTAGATRDHLRLLSFPDGSLLADTLEISVGAGGTQDLSLNGGPGLASALYLVLGSASGTEPPTPIDLVQLPLVPDNYTLTTLNQPPALSGFAGALDANGRASANISLPPNAPATLIGLEVHHAWIGFPDPLVPLVGFASSAVALRLLP